MGLIMYALLSGKFLILLRKKEIYLGVISFVLVMAAYYYFREQVNPGYWQAVQENELGGRFLKTLEEHNKPWYFYLTGDKFMPWLLLILPAMFVAYRFAEGITRRFSLFATLFFFGFLITISSAQTKLLWYAIPLYPMGGLLVAIGLYYAFQWLIHRFRLRHPRRFILVTSVLIFGVFYGIIVGRVISQPRKDKQDLMALDTYFLKDFRRQHPQQKRYTYLSQEAYNSSLDFYLLKFRHQGDTITDKRDHGDKKDYSQLRNLHPSEIVLTCHPDLKARLVTEYETEELQNQDTCIAVRIIGNK